MSVGVQTGRLTLSFTQERLWFLDQLEIGNSVYTLSATYHLKGQLDKSALKVSLEQIISRHHVLRTRYQSHEGQPQLGLASNLTMDVPLEIDLSEKRDRPVNYLITEELTNVSFDLEFGPLFFIKLLRLADDEHLLFITAHRSIFDEKSLTLLMEELADYYNQAAKGEALKPPKLASQYPDFAAWQRADLQSQSQQEQFEFWKENLKDASLVLELPTDKARPPVQSLQANNLYFETSYSEVENLCNGLNISPYSVLLAAFNTLIYRYTSREDILVGGVVNNRPRPEFESLLGAFTNTLILRTLIAEEATFTELAQHQEGAVNMALANQQLPFEVLLNEMRPERDMSRSPLIQVFFDFQEKATAVPKFDGLGIEKLAIDNPFSQYDLELNLWRDGDVLRGKITYATDLFNQETIERMAGHYHNLLVGITENPDQPLHRLPLLTEAETHQLLVDWNNTEFEYEDVRPVYRLFETQVEKNPQAIAAIYEGEEVTYDELNRRANRLAHFLVEQGVKADTIVAILANRSINYLTALLGIHKAGGAFLPLDPRHPAARIAQILTQSESLLVLTDETYANHLDNQVEIATHQLETVISQDYSDENLAQTAGFNDLAYVMFTSGSTGMPKGVMVEHLGMINHNYAKIRDVGMTSQDILAQNGPQSFDIMVWQFVSPLIVGAKICIFKDEIAYNPPVLYQHIQHEKITILQIVPSLLTTIIQDANTRGTPLELPHLRWIVPTGEALPTELCRQWLQFYPNIPLLNTYGSTECSDDQCHYPVKFVTPDYRLPIMTIGTPIPNMRLYILDKWKQPVPIGVIGELYVGGIGVGRGYLKDPQKTANAFMDDPFVQDGRMYKTGDQGRFMPDGTVEFLGRIDHMVKVRGYRIELGEIESVLNQHPAVNQSVVIVHEDTQKQKRLVGYVVRDPNQQPTSTELRDYVGEKLPEYMIPSTIIVMDTFPLTGNQKVDRKALPLPDFAKQLAEGYMKPNTPTETKLCQIWSEVLGIPKVGIQDNFFELGGYSLLAIRIFSQIERQFGKQLLLGTLFQAPTIEELAKIIDDKEDLVWSPVVTIQGKGGKPPFFCVGGGVLHMRNISKHLGLKQPFYALQTEAISDDKVMKAQIELIAEELIAEIRRIQPTGPYYLGGAYASGIVTLEIAHQLKAQGEEIAILVGFNTLPARHSEGFNDSSIYERAFRKLKKIALKNPVKAVREDIDWVHVQGYMMNSFWKVAYKFYSSIGKPLPRYLRQGEYADILLRRAVSKYQPKSPYDGRVTLFLTGEWAAHYDGDPKWGWGEYVYPETPIEMHFMPGDPCTMFTEPNAYVVANQLHVSLDNAQSKYPIGTSSEEVEETSKLSAEYA